MYIFRRFFSVVFSLIIVICGCSDEKLFKKSAEKYNYDNILVKRVIDGDTFELEGGERVRLIGIDTPEIHFSKRLSKQGKRAKKDIETIKALGREAAQFAKNLIEGEKVHLEFDVDKYDRYKRLLAYVYLKDGTFVNEKIVREGYALLYTVPPNVKYKDVFLEAQKEARQKERGLWGK